MTLWNYCQKVLYCILNVGFRIIGHDLTDDIFQSIMQFVKFGIVGVSNTVISYIIYVVGLVLLQKIDFWPQYDYLFAQVAAFVISVLWSFYWNSKMVFTFRRREKTIGLESTDKNIYILFFYGIIFN